MPKPSYKGIARLLLVAVLVILVPLIINLLTGGVETWLKLHAGEGYKFHLVALLLFSAVVWVLLTTNVGKWLLPGNNDKSSNLPPGTPDPEMVIRVRQYLKSRCEHRLSQKLAGRQPVNLRILPSVSGISDESAGNLMTLEEEDVRGAIGDIFTRANGRLMLIGLPGSGKTTIVLQLALHLLERQDGSFPVVLNLATWRSEFQTFEAWLRRILPAELGASTGLAEQIRKSLPLILLLDGLDEVPEADRDSLISVIGEYGADPNRQFLISSRTAEYSFTKDAPVNAQVEVAPLTIEQVEMSLSASAHIQPEARRLLNAIKSDPLLRSAVENPFYLNTAQLLFASGKNWSELGFKATDVTGRQKELVERFVERALNFKTGNQYPPRKTRHWLSFLASRMTLRNIVTFELRDLQNNWWNGSFVEMFWAWLVNGLVYGLFFGLIGGLTIGVIGGLLIGVTGVFLISPIKGLLAGLIILFFMFLLLLSLGIIIGVAAGIVAGLNRGLYGYDVGKRSWPSINTKDKVKWSSKMFIEKFITKKNLISSLILVLLEGIIIASFMWQDSIQLLWIKNRWVFGLIGGLLIGVAFSFANIFVFFFTKNHIFFIKINNPYQRFKGSMKSLYFSILQHWLLRFQLYKRGLLPLQLVEFLSEMTSRHVMETDSATWRFRHRILQDYFAEHWVESNHNHEGNANPNE